MKAMHELDTEDVEWINITGNYWRGKAAVYKGHDTIHRTIFENTSMTVEETAIRPIAPNVAVAVATMTFGPVITPTGQKVPVTKTRGSFTAVKRDGIWRIAHFQNTTGEIRSGEKRSITWDAERFPAWWQGV